MEPEIPGWTGNDVGKLLHAIKKHIPKRHKNSEYTQAQKHVKWDMVAFHPYSSEVCEKKWEEILVELQKVRTLSELIDDAQVRLVRCKKNKKKKKQGPSSWENNNVPQTPLLSSGESTSTAESVPVKPPGNGYILFIKEQGASCMQQDLLPSKNTVVVCAQSWKSLTQSQKDNYNARCKELKQEYEVKMRKYLQACPKALRSMAKPVFTGEPQKPSELGNVVFCKEQMELMKNKIPHTRERLAKISPMWRKLSQRERCCYKRKAEEKLEEYAVELRKWFKTLTAEEQAQYKHLKPSHVKYLISQEDRKKNREEEKKCRPSDSEDEDFEDSNSDDDLVADFDPAEEEEDEDNKMFWSHEMEESNHNGNITDNLDDYAD